MTNASPQNRRPPRGRRRLRLPILLLALAGGVGGLTACGDSGGGSAEKTIGISFPNSSKQPVVLNLFKMAKARAKADGYKLVIHDPGTDAARQVSTLQSWIQQGYGSVVVSALDPKILASAAGKAKDAGVKWVTFADKVPGQAATLGFPHREAGEKLGEAAGKWIAAHGGTSSVALLGYQSASYARERAAGILSGLRKTAPKAKVVATQDAVAATEGLDATQTILQAHPAVDVVLAVEDSAGEGAYNAMVKAGHAKDDPKIFVGGINGAENELKLVQQGTMYRATAAFDQTVLGEGLVTLPARLLAGKGGDLYTPVTLVEHGDPAIERLLKSYH